VVERAENISGLFEFSHAFLLSHAFFFEKLAKIQGFQWAENGKAKIEAKSRDSDC
jgi:hypothetical protein